MSTHVNKFEEYIKELLDQELEEASTTGAIDGGEGPPKTPYAFTGDSEEDEKKKDRIMKAGGYMKVESLDENILKQIQQAEKIAKSMAGNMTGAVRGIEKIRRGLSHHKRVKVALKKYNESVNESISVFDVDFYKDNNSNQTSHKEIIRGDKFSDVISKTTKVAKSKKMNYVELYYKGAFIGSIDKRNSFKFKKGRNHQKSPLSVNEGQKKQASVILRKFDMAYIKFSQEVRDVMKLMDKSTGSKVDGKIIEKAYGKHLIPFDDLMQSWAKGQQENPGLSEELGGTRNKAEIENIAKYLMKKGDNKKDVLDKIKQNYDYVSKKYRSASVSKKADILTSLQESVNEGKYHDYRNDESLTPRQKIGSSMREVKNSLNELSKLIDMNVKLKNELNVNSQSYWKNTHKALNKIGERLVKLANKVGQLQ